MNYISDNVLVITFGDDPASDNNAYQALTDLKALDTQGQITVTEAAVVTREADGSVTVKSDVGKDVYEGTAAGGMVGLLVGVIGGPFGVLVGGATGLLAGSLFDLEDIDDTQSVLGKISTSVQPSRTAVIAQVTEPSAEVIDNAMARVGGDVLRQPFADVETELAAAEQAQRQAKREARKELAKARLEKQRTDAHRRVEELKSKLNRTPAGV